MRFMRVWALLALLATLAARRWRWPARPQAAPTGIDGYVWGNQPANPDYFPNTGYEYNSAGGAVQIVRPVPRSYHVIFHDLGRGRTTVRPEEGAPPPPKG